MNPIIKNLEQQKAKWEAVLDDHYPLVSIDNPKIKQAMEKYQELKKDIEWHKGGKHELSKYN